MLPFPLAAHAVYRVFSNLHRLFANLIWSLNGAMIPHLRTARKGVLKKIKKNFGPKGQAFCWAFCWAKNFLRCAWDCAEHRRATGARTGRARQNGGAPGIARSMGEPGVRARGAHGKTAPRPGLCRTWAIQCCAHEARTARRRSAWAWAEPLASQGAGPAARGEGIALPLAAREAVLPGAPQWHVNASAPGKALRKDARAFHAPPRWRRSQSMAPRASSNWESR